MSVFKLAFTAFVIATVICTSCSSIVMHGEGKRTTVTPTVTSFNGVDASVPLRIVITVTPGATPSVSMEGYENIIAHLKTSVEKNKLIIDSDFKGAWSVDKTSDVVINVVVPSLESVDLSGAAEAVVHGDITGKNFAAELSGSCDIEIDKISVDEFTVDLSGSGDISVNGGNVQKAEYHISGAANVKAYPLQTAETLADISGAGSAHVSASSKLTADISGAASVKYKGHPQVIKDVSGAGTVAEAN